VGDLKCPKCGYNTFQVRTDTRRMASFVCVACWKDLRLKDMTQEFLGVKEQAARTLLGDCYPSPARGVTVSATDLADVSGCPHLLQ
jgi:DNA-directed RNA polymerase subunit RPC12/RpoP